MGTSAEFQSFLKDNMSIKIYVDIKNISGDEKGGWKFIEETPGRGVLPPENLINS